MFIASDGRIIIYGGQTANQLTFYTDVAVLNTNTWQWSVIGIQPNAPSGRAGEH